MVESALPFPKRAALDFAYEENESQMKKKLMGHPVLAHIMRGVDILYSTRRNIYLYIVLYSVIQYLLMNGSTTRTLDKPAKAQASSLRCCSTGNHRNARSMTRRFLLTANVTKRLESFQKFIYKSLTVNREHYMCCDWLNSPTTTSRAANTTQQRKAKTLLQCTRRPRVSYA